MNNLVEEDDQELTPRTSITEIIHLLRERTVLHHKMKSAEKSGDHLTAQKLKAQLYDFKMKADADKTTTNVSNQPSPTSVDSDYSGIMADCTSHDETEMARVLAGK